MPEPPTSPPPTEEPTHLLLPPHGRVAGAREAAPLAPGVVLGRYFVLAEIGRGGMGVVYAAFDRELERKVALKILHAGLGQGLGAEGRTRLLREAKALARLSHPNVVQIYDAGRVGEGGDEGPVFLAMELAEGMPLDVWLEKRHPWRRIVDVFLAAGRGLAAAHAAGLVHRDFKPSNVLLGDDGRVRVLDFGIARAESDTTPSDLVAVEAALGAGTIGTLGTLGALGAPLTRAGTAPGTVRYMAPEALLGKTVDAQADQFSFCVALHAALYGIRPYGGDSGYALLDSMMAGRLQEVPKDSRVPPWIRRILLRGLQREPEARYPSMAALLADLGQDRTARRRNLLALAATAALVAGSGFVLYRTATVPARLCAGAESKLTGVWDAGRKTAIRRAFLASGRPYSADAWFGVEQRLDGYTRSWAAQRKEACEATQVRGEQSQELLDLRMHCLDRRLGDLRALTALFSTGSPDVVERAVAASQNLPGLAGCADTAALTAPIPPPAGKAARREVDRLETEVASARALWTTGRYAEARKAADGTVTRAARLGYAPVLAEALHTRFLAEDSLNTFAQAEETLFSALTAGQRGHHDALVARGWIDLIWEAGFRQRKYGEAKRWAEMATASLERLGGEAENPALDADLKSNLGATLDQEGEHEAGISLLREALPLYQKALGPDDPAVSRTLNRIGTAYYNLKRYDEALDAYRRALDATRRTLGARHPTVAVRLGNMSLVLQDQGKLEESLQALLESKAIEEGALGPNHPRLAITHSNLASLLGDMGRPAEALEHARRAVAIDEVNDPDPADAGASWSNVADDLFLLGRYAEAAEAARKARGLMVRAEGAPEGWIAAVDTTLGRAVFAQGRKREAIAPLRRALAGFRAGGEESLALAHAQFTLAKALWETGGDRAEAVALARKAREITARYPRARDHEIPTLDAWLAERGGR